MTRTNRRKFIESLSRKLMLGGIAAASGYLLFRESDHNCDIVIGCGTCDRLSGCRLPGAEDFKKHHKPINPKQDGEAQK